MPGWELIREDVAPFDGVDMTTSYRIAGTWSDRENYTIDVVEVPARCSRYEWRTINRLHPLYRVIDKWLETQAALDVIDEAISAEMRDDYEELEPVSRYALAAE